MVGSLGLCLCVPRWTEREECWCGRLFFSSVCVFVESWLPPFSINLPPFLWCLKVVFCRGETSRKRSLIFAGVSGRHWGGAALDDLNRLLCRFYSAKDDLLQKEGERKRDRERI